MPTLRIDEDLTQDFARAFRDQLATVDGQAIEVRINSAGGDVNAGLALYADLRRHRGGLTTVADSLVASAAVLPFLAGDTRVVHEASVIVVHAAWTARGGNARSLDEQAAMLRQYDQQLISIYSTRTGKPESEFKQLMADGADHVFIGQDIIEAGFATVAIESEDAVMVAAHLGRDSRELQARAVLDAMNRCTDPAGRTALYRKHREIFKAL